MENKKKYFGSFIFSLVLLVVTFCVILSENSLSDITDALTNAKIEYIIIGIIMVLAFLGIQSIYLKIIFKYLGEKITFIKGMVYACIEFYFSGITPSSTGGQPVEMYYMKKDNIPYGKSSIVVLLLTAIFKFTLILLGTFALIFKSELILRNGLVFNIFFFLGITVNMAVIVACLILMFNRNLLKGIVVKTIKMMKKMKLIRHPRKLINKFAKLLDEYGQGAKYIKENIGLSIKVTILTIFQRVALFSVGFFVYRALGLNEYAFWDLLFIQVAVAMAVDSLPLPGGIGASEAMLTIIYEKVFGADVVVPAMLLTRCISYYFCLIFTGIVSLINHVVTKKPQVDVQEFK